MVLAKITIKHGRSNSVRGVAAYVGLLCAVYSVRVAYVLLLFKFLSFFKFIFY